MNDFDRVYDRAAPMREGTMTLYDPETHTACVSWDDGKKERDLDADCLGQIPGEAA